MVNTLLLIFAPTLATQWDKESDTAMKNHRHRSAFYCHFSGVCSVPGSVLAAVGQAARVSTALPEFTVCWRDQSLHMTLLMWWDYHKGSSHTQLLTVPKSHPMQWVEPCVCVCVCTQLHLFATPWTAAHQASLSMGFSRQEYWGGLPFPSPEECSDRKSVV